MLHKKGLEHSQNRAQRIRGLLGALPARRSAPAGVQLLPAGGPRPSAGRGLLAPRKSPVPFESKGPKTYLKPSSICLRLFFFFFFPPVGFKGKLSLLEISIIFPGV